MRFLLLWHRRAGKDLDAWNFTWTKALERVGSYYYFLPTYKLCKQIIWDGMDSQGRRYLEYIPPECLGAPPNESELLISLINGSNIQLLTAGDIDKSAIGTNCVGVVYSEYSTYATSQPWDYVRPILNENGGWAMFCYTPRGQNHGYTLFRAAERNPKWFVSFKDITMTMRDSEGEAGGPVVTENLVQEDRDSGMPEELIQQEYYLSFKGFQQGSYFGDQYADAEADGRFTSIPWRPLEPVNLVCDLGIGMKFVWWCWQRIGEKIHVINYHVLESGGIPEFAQWVGQQRYVWGDLFAPHDITTRDESTGVTRLETARQYNLHFRKVPRLPVEERVNAGRLIFPLCYFDEARCREGLRALLNYRREYDMVKQEYKRAELHDWASHGGSAFCYMGVANRDLLRKAPVAPVAQFAETAFDPFHYEEYDTDWSPMEDAYHA